MRSSLTLFILPLILTGKDIVVTGHSTFWGGYCPNSVLCIVQYHFSKWAIQIAANLRVLMPISISETKRQFRIDTE